MRAALLSHQPLVALLGGHHVFEELPRGAAPAPCGLRRDRDARLEHRRRERAEEHFVTLSVRTNSRGRRLAQEICDAVNTALDGRALPLAGHQLVNLRVIFWTVARDKNARPSPRRCAFAPRPNRYRRTPHGSTTGRDLLLKIDADGTRAYQTVAGLRSNTISFNAETVDVTHQELAGQWRELLAGAGLTLGGDPRLAASSRMPPPTRRSAIASSPAPSAPGR